MLQDKIRAALADRVLNVVAERTGLSRHTISTIASGTRNAHPATLKVLAEYLGISDDKA